MILVNAFKALYVDIFLLVITVTNKANHQIDVIFGVFILVTLHQEKH